MSHPPVHGAYYDGALYARLIDPLLARQRALVAEAVPAGASLLDACCGTGALALQCAPRCSAVLGIDLSRRMIAHANTALARHRYDHVSFRLADAAALHDIADRAFDLATLVMALHEMPDTARLGVLRELARVARGIILVDYAAPMPVNRTGVRFRVLEVLAGRRHFAGYRDFQRRRGLPPLIEAAGLSVVRHGRADSGNLDIYTLAS